VAEVCGPEAQVKWPNDVLIDGRKVAGILVESRPQERWAVLGIGLNVAIAPDQFPAELQDTATTLNLPPSAIEDLLEHLLTALTQWTLAGDEPILAAVRRRDALRGRPVSWTGGRGTAAGIDGAGRLVVQTDAGRVALESGEVHLAR
jgi:BirA family biotin operon repressor/biotin-[acetyl-CoA-carboxylase] ligase